MTDYSGESVPTFTVVKRYEERVRVTMTWEVEADLEDTEGGQMRCVGWLSNASVVIDKCRLREPQRVEIERIEAPT